MRTSIEYKRLAREELGSVADINRQERIDVIYEQRVADLHERPGNWDSPGWDPNGSHEHSVAADGGTETDVGGGGGGGGFETRH